MLVLSRKPLESILIGADVKVTILKVERSHVRIGIEAPGSVTILRAELLVDDGKDPFAPDQLEQEDAPAIATH